MAAFERSTEDPESAQAGALAKIVGLNADTAFGRAHGFHAIRTPTDFAAAVPIHDYEDLRPYVDRMVAGEPRVLTAEAPLLYQRTSGTTGLPKLVPAPPSWCDELAAVNRLWVLQVSRDHPPALSGRTLLVSGPAVEGRTACGVPIGSALGLANRRLPWVIRRRFAIPAAVADVADPDDRYFLTLRIALQHAVTVIATPNATTLLRLAEVMQARAGELLTALADGGLGVTPTFVDETDPGVALAELRDACRPDPARARELATAVMDTGALLPSLAWPGLGLVGCWLGGSAGTHARRIRGDYGQAPLRDLGLIATEARVTMPFGDDEPAGTLCLNSVYCEFTGVDESGSSVRGAHELEDGKAYNVVITGSNGLYRYNLRDIVEVRGYHGRTPRLAFLRKAGDFVSITGEKVHLNQFEDAVRAAEAVTGLHPWQFRVVPDVEGLRHDLLVELAQPVSDARAREFVAAFDRRLGEVNFEYASKRSSQRLRPPCLHAMRRGWSQRIAQDDCARGGREQQYKWVNLPRSWDDISRSEVELSVEATAAPR